MDFALALPGYQGDEDGRMVYGEFHHELEQVGQGHPWVSRVVPRKHAKSTLFSQIKPAWQIIRSRGKERIMLGSATLSLAKQNAGKIRDILSGNIILDGHEVPLADVFPWAKPVNKLNSTGPVGAFNVVGRSGIGKEASIFTGAPGTNLAGTRPTYVNLDDIVNEQNSRTREQRQKVIEFIQQVESLLYLPTCTIDMVSTFWHPEDATVYVGKRRGWFQKVYDIYVDADPRRSVEGEDRPTICPAFINAEEANAMEMAALAEGKYAYFSSQYRSRPYASDDPLFTEEMWTHACTQKVSKDILPGKGGTFLLWDPVNTLGTATKKMDRNGIIVVRAIPGSLLPWTVPDPRRNVFVPIFANEISGGADMALAQIEKWVQEGRWPDLRSIWTEDIVGQIFLAPWAKERGRIGGVTIRGQKIPRVELPMRLSGIQTAFREGYIVIPRDMEGGDLLRSRLLNLPGDYDDVPAALALLSSHLERRGRLPGDESGPTPLTFEQGGPLPRPRGGGGTLLLS